MNQRSLDGLTISLGISSVFSYLERDAPQHLLAFPQKADYPSSDYKLPADSFPYSSTAYLRDVKLISYKGPKLAFMVPADIMKQEMTSFHI